MSDVKRSTEHKLEVNDVSISISAPDADTIRIHTKKHSYSSMALDVVDINDLIKALRDFDLWIKGNSGEVTNDG